MRIVKACPPLIEEIDAAFKVRGKPVAYAWGETIFNPEILPEIVAHEKVHGKRQGAAIEEWWRRYIADPEFRLAEEMPAHLAEYNAMCALYRASWVSARAMRRTYAAHIARKLSAPLYGGLIKFEDARQLMLRAGESSLNDRRRRDERAEAL